MTSQSRKSGVDPVAKAYVDAINKWTKDYGIDFKKSLEGDEVTDAQRKNLEKLNSKKLVWTEHSTCDGNYYSSGYQIFSEDSCCYRSLAFHIGSKPWVGDEDTLIQFEATVYMPCSVCNAEEDGEGQEDCPGPGVPKGASRDDCEGGYINWYFD